MKTDKTNVQFYYHEENKDLYAFFPDQIHSESPLMFSSYAHIGQHIGCSIDYTKESRHATTEESADLKKELENLGYNLNVI